MWRGQDWWLLCPIYLHELGNSLQRTSERVSFVFLIDAFGALVIPYVLAPVVHIEAKGPQPTSCFSRFRPCCIQFPFVLRGYPPLSLELDLKEFPFAPALFPPLVDQQVYNGGHLGHRPGVNVACGKTTSLLWAPLDDSLQGLDGGPVSRCLRAWCRPNSRTPAFAPHRMT